MRKLLLAAFIAVFSVTVMQAQTFKIGATAGLPSADASNFSSFVLGIDAYYYFTDIDDFINIGGTVGYRNFFGDDVNILGLTVPVDDAQFLPVAVAARLKIFGLFGAGADIGYAFGLSDGLDGGFYFRPVLTFDIWDAIELNMSYESITDFANWGNFNVGVLFQF